MIFSHNPTNQQKYTGMTFQQTVLLKNLKNISTQAFFSFLRNEWTYLFANAVLQSHPNFRTCRWPEKDPHSLVLWPGRPAPPPPPAHSATVMQDHADPVMKKRDVCMFVGAISSGAQCFCIKSPTSNWFHGTNN